MMVGLVYSGSRGGWIALAAGVAALVIFGIRQGTTRWWVPVAGALILTVVAGGIFSFTTLIQARLAESDKLLVTHGKVERYMRFELVKDALRIARDHPFFGTGPATFIFVHPHYEGDTFAWTDVLTHNDYLNCLDDYGFVGFGIAMFFVAAVTLKFFQPLWVDHRWQDRTLVATGFAAWCALLGPFVDRLQPFTYRPTRYGCSR